MELSTIITIIVSVISVIFFIALAHISESCLRKNPTYKQERGCSYVFSIICLIIGYLVIVAMILGVIYGVIGGRQIV